MFQVDGCLRVRHPVPHDLLPLAQERAEPELVHPGGGRGLPGHLVEERPLRHQLRVLLHGTNRDNCN